MSGASFVRVQLLLALCAAALATTAMVSMVLPGAPESWAPAPRTIAGLRVTAVAREGRIVLHTAGGRRDFLPGVDLGSTVPGRAPGELAVTARDYRRWFP